MEINTLEDLFRLVKPSLKVKKDELLRKGYNYISEDDIWNYLKDVKWSNAKRLELYQMVSDILHADEVLIDGYLKKQFQMKNRHVYFE